VSACTCVDGYNESASGDCTDINECDTGSPCDVAAACNNTLGSFTCVCNAGYHGNGSACQACDAGYTCSIELHGMSLERHKCKRLRVLLLSVRVHRE
jgi:hypothetical protein